MTNAVKWIKITTDMFDNHKIKHLRRLPEGNNIVLIWVMLLTMAGRCNAGGMIFLTENIPYTPKMLADELDFEENTVILALQALEQLEMVYTSGDYLTIPGWEEYQNFEGLERIREQNRLRKQRQREREKAMFHALPFGDESEELPAAIVTDDESAILSAAETETDECAEGETVPEQDAAEPQKTDIGELLGALKEKHGDPETRLYKEIIEYLNEKSGTNYRASSAKTQKCIHARLVEGYTVDDFKTVIDKKCGDWRGTEFEQYLRPSTLFGTKFEEYLNRNISKAQKPGGNVKNGYPFGEALDDLDGIF